MARITEAQVNKLRQYSIALKDKATKKRLEKRLINRAEAGKLIAIFSKML